MSPIAELTDKYLNLWLRAATLEPDMTNSRTTTNQSSDELLRFAAERTKHLSSSSAEERRSIEWHHEAAHVGDISVLALALMRTG